MFAKIALFFLAAAPAAFAVQDSISLPDSLWAGDSITWERKVPNYCEGPAYEAATGAVYFTVQTASAANWPIYRVVPGVDSGGIWYNTKQNNGLAFDPHGRLVACENGQVVRLKPNGNAGALDTVLATFTSTTQSNDLTIGKAGDIYFSGYNDGKVYYINPAGALSTVLTGISSSNGIEWLTTLDSNAVYVNGTTAGAVYRYTRNPSTGALTGQTTFISVTQPDGGAVDSHGNHYVASYGNGEIRVYNFAGTFLGRIAMRRQSGIYDSVSSQGRTGKQGNADNAVFGGADMKTLYITGDGGLFSIPLKIPGVPASVPTALRGLNFTPAKPGMTEYGRDARGRKVSPAYRKKSFIEVLPEKPRE